MPHQPESASDVLGQSPVFRALRAAAEKHEKLLDIVRTALPRTLSEHCNGCLSKDGRLVIFADSPAWASQLRFFGPAILEKLRARGVEDFRDIQVRNLRREAPPVKNKPMSSPSPEVARMVRKSASDAATAELRAALMRLGATMERYAGRE